jgi:hypothetical protein
LAKVKSEREKGALVSRREETSTTTKELTKPTTTDFDLDGTNGEKIPEVNIIEEDVWNTNCGDIVDFYHETKVVRLTLLQLLVDQSLHKAWHLDRAWHLALGWGPFLSPDKFDCSAHSHFTNSVATKTQYPHTPSFWRG